MTVDDERPGDGPVRFMRQVISLDYVARPSPVGRRFAGGLAAGRITGHRCPECARVYVPPKGFCPICVVETGVADEVDVSDVGTVTAWTVLTPIQYHGQTEREDYALASILLDGADGTVGQQRLVDAALDDIRMGMRVRAVWADPSERDADVDARGYGFGSAVRGFRPTGEPDADRSAYAEHVL
ncbi:MAG TPA: Zn-ribbon domain-containing OB-fold protein [Acidimicrobiales bacterium]